MHVSSRIHGGRSLRNHIQDGFDYEQFCKKISGMLGWLLLSAEEQQQVKVLFNPKTNYRDFIYGLWELQGFRVPNLSYHQFQHHPVHKVWEEAWKETYRHFKDAIPAYEAATEVEREKLRQKLHRPLTIERKEYLRATIGYPHIIPPLELGCSLQGEAAYAAITTTHAVVNEAFLALPERLQRAYFLHEAAHFFEAVPAKLLPRDYHITQEEKTFRGMMHRKREYKADELGTIINSTDPYAMADALKLRDSEHFNSLHFVYDKATQAGFNFNDCGRRLQRDIRKKIPWSMQDTVEDYMSYVMEAAKNKVNTHPSHARRIERIHKVAYHEKIKNNPGSLLGL